MTSLFSVYSHSNSPMSTAVRLEIFRVEMEVVEDIAYLEIMYLINNGTA